jgi:hypothetical protein
LTAVVAKNESRVRQALSHRELIQSLLAAV